jgi:uncharacterized metal-binding protein
MSQEKKLPLVYSCSGASSAAQMANHIAVKLDRLQVAEMSCIAGVGGDVKPLVRTAKSGRPIIALDGCPLHCAAHILKRHGITADQHYDLSKMGVKKQYHEDFDPQEAAQMLQQIRDTIRPAAAVETNSVATPNNAASSPTRPSPNSADDEPYEPSSPPCYLNEFKNW